MQQPPHMFGNSSDLGVRGLGSMANLYDPTTKLLLTDIGVRAGSRCLDIGAGEGSVARWMAERSGPAGRVVATDIDIAHLKPSSGVEVYRHDINTGMPVGGSFDLIHARNVLARLPRREEIFATLVDALAPGGWIVIGDFRDRPQEMLSAPCDQDAELAVGITRTVIDDIAVAAGVSWAWADEVEKHMTAAGLADIDGVAHSRMLSGGNAACGLNDSYVRQVEPLLHDFGYSQTDIDRFHELMRDPDFRAWPSLQLVYTAGRKPED